MICLLIKFVTKNSNAEKLGKNVNCIFNNAHGNARLMAGLLLKRDSVDSDRAEDRAKCHGGIL